MVALAVIVFSILVSAGWWGPGFFQPVFQGWLDSTGRVHVLWSCMFYGGLFVAAYRLSMQSERTRGLLAGAEIARQKSEFLFSEARLLSLQGHVDPAFLLRAMLEVEQRYARDSVSMGRLLDALVTFLRAAMPGVRSGASTLAAEVLLAEQYAQVWAELDPGRATLTIRIAGVMPDLPFPALLLLPVLDQLASAKGSARPIELHVTQTDGHCILALACGVHGQELQLAPELLYRMQVGLRASFGDAWKLETDAASSAVVLMLPLTRAVDRRASSCPHSSPPNQEMSHG